MADITKKKAIDILHRLKQRASQLDYEDADTAKFNKWHRDVEVALGHIFEKDSRHLVDFTEINYEDEEDDTEEQEVNTFETNMELADAILQSMIDEIRQYWREDTETRQIQSNREAQVEAGLTNKRVFIVHGHDETMKQSIARTLERLGLTPVILHELPSKGKTIIEKFTDYSDVSFAVVLLSGDDAAFPRNSSPDRAKPRARQNVILELGYFLGKLGRDRVLALYRGGRDFEMPSDYNGVVYTPFDDAGNWQFKLVQELKACGFNIDANALL